jgi:hypothetical protein
VRSNPAAALSYTSVLESASLSGVLLAKLVLMTGSQYYVVQDPRLKPLQAFWHELVLHLQPQLSGTDESLRIWSSETKALSLTACCLSNILQLIGLVCLPVGS